MYLNDEAVLKVENLRVGFGEEEKREVVRNISFQIKKGEVLCLVGESGSGKSVTAFSIMQLFHGTTGMILGGKILVNGTNLAELSEKEMQKRRGNEIAMVFQEPMTSLNPVITIGVQMARAMRLHQKLEKQKVREKSIQLLEKVGIKHATVEITASILLSLFFTQTIPKNTDNMESITTVVSATINVVGIREHIFSHTLTPYLYEVPKSNLVNTPIIYSKNLFRNG